MKDYYRILNVADSATQDEIRSAFRRLAFRHHPDTNPGSVHEAEEKFKEINEAYGVLGDAARRRQYDAARRSPLSGAGFGFSQQDIFRDAFANQASYADLSRMFRQAGLRFDEDFLSRVFFGGGGLAFRAFTGPQRRPRGQPGSSGQPGAPAEEPVVRPPGFISRFLVRALLKFLGFLLSRAFGADVLRPRSLDQHVDFVITTAEALAGAEKPVTYQRDGQARRLMVKIPAGISPGTEIRLRGMGIKGNGTPGDLYLRVRIEGRPPAAR